MGDPIPVHWLDKRVKSFLKVENLFRDLQNDFLEQLYTLEQGNMPVTDYARKYKELFIKSGVVENERMAMA